MGRRKKKKPKNPPQATEEPSRRSLLKYGLFIGGIGLVGGTAAIKFVNQDEPANDPPQPGRTQSVIDYSTARQKSNLRQAYLNQLLTDTTKHTHNWNKISRLLYDPDKHVVDAVLTSHNLSTQGAYGKSGHNTTLMSTPLFSSSPQATSIVYVHDGAFSLTYQEGDLLSTVDHEALHAFHHYSGGVGSGNVPLDSALISLMGEAIAFNHQLEFVESGKRQVSQRYIDSLTPSMREVYSRIEDFANQQTDQGIAARSFLDQLHEKNTIKYFLE